MNLNLTPSEMTNRDVAELVERIPDLRLSVWQANGIKAWTHKVVMAWLDDLGVTTRRKHRRELRMPLDEVKAKILQTPFVPPKFERSNTRADGYESYHTWTLIEPGPHSLFSKGASFTVSEIRAEIGADGSTIFANGSRFVNEATGDTAYWYEGQLWADGPQPKPYYASRRST